MFASSSRGGAAAKGRGATGGGGKYSLEELYGLNKKSKTRGGDGVQRRSPKRQGLPLGSDWEALFSPQGVEATRCCLEKRRMESYLMEAGMTVEEAERSQTSMRHRYVGRSAGFLLQVFLKILISGNAPVRRFQSILAYRSS